MHAAAAAAAAATAAPAAAASAMATSALPESPALPELGGIVVQEAFQKCCAWASHLQCDRPFTDCNGLGYVKTRVLMHVMQTACRVVRG